MSDCGVLSVCVSEWVWRGRGRGRCCCCCCFGCQSSERKL